MLILIGARFHQHTIVTSIDLPKATPANTISNKDTISKSTQRTHLFLLRHGLAHEVQLGVLVREVRAAVTIVVVIVTASALVGGGGVGAVSAVLLGGEGGVLLEW